jgi:hypothetical protein
VERIKNQEKNFDLPADLKIYWFYIFQTKKTLKFSEQQWQFHAKKFKCVPIVKLLSEPSMRSFYHNRGHVSALLTRTKNAVYFTTLKRKFLDHTLCLSKNWPLETPCYIKAMFCCNKCINNKNITLAYNKAFSREVRIFNGLNLQIAIFILTYKIARKFKKDSIFVEMGGEETMAEILIYNPKFTKTINDLRPNNFDDQSFRRRIIFEIACDQAVFQDQLIFPAKCLPFGESLKNIFYNICLKKAKFTTVNLLFSRYTIFL